VAAPLAREHRKVLHMGGLVKSDNLTHNAAVLAAEVVRQNAVASATTDAAGALIVKNAEITYHRAVVASAKANLSAGVGAAASLAALRELGVGS
jgi:hypothetical protein